MDPTSQLDDNHFLYYSVGASQRINSNVQGKNAPPLKHWKSSLDLEGKAPPRPSDVKSNLKKGRMWLISDYNLNEG